MVRKKVVPATVRLGRGVAAAAVVSSFILHDLGFVLDTVLAMPHNYFDLGLDHPDRAGTPGSRPPSWQVLNYTPDVLDEVVHSTDFLEDDGNSQDTPERRPMASPSASPEQRPMASPAGSGTATPRTREPSPAHTPETYTNTKGGDHRDRPQCDVNASNKPSKKKKKVTGARHIEHAVTPFGVVAVARNGYGAPQESKASASGSADARMKVNEFTVTPDVLSLKERMNELRKDLASSRMANIERDEEAMGAGKSYRNIWWTPSVRMLTETEVADLLRPDMEVEGVVPTAVGGLSLLEQLYTTRCTSHGCDREQAEDLLAKVVGGHELLGLADDFADEGEHASGSWDEHEQQLRHGRGEHEEHRDLSKVGQRHDLRRSRYSYPSACAAF
eukprot:g10684.t1